MKAKEQKKDRSKAPIQEIEEKDLNLTKAGTVRSIAACDCVCLASAECAC